MNDPMFAAVVSARLDPLLAPRGFPYAAEHNGVSAPGQPARVNPDGVLFHCDGVDAVGEVVARYPGWGDPTPSELRGAGDLLPRS